MSEHNAQPVERLATEVPPSVAVECPNPSCSARALLPKSIAGLSIRCRLCGTTFVTPSDDQTPDATSAAAALAKQNEASTSLPPQIGRFEVRRRVGEGAFGTVYRAFDPHLQRDVALKVARTGTLNSPRRVERFLGDARAAARLRHPNIVPVFDAGQEGDNYFIASAFIEGRTLSEALELEQLDRRQAVAIVRALAEALSYAHEQGIVHRDVKPDNVMLDERGEPHLIDFGLARRQESTDAEDEDEPVPPETKDDSDEAGPARRTRGARRTMAGAVLGTAHYMSPEQASGHSGEARPAFDQYSLGVTLYELLTGRTPFTGPTAVVLYNAIHTEPPPPRTLVPDLPLDLEVICLKAMAKKAEDRYPGCKELAEDLRRWLAGEPIVARPLRPWERLIRWCRREPALASAVGVAAAAILAVAILGAVYGVARSRQAEKLDKSLTATKAAREKAEVETAKTELALKDAKDARKVAEDRTKKLQRQRAELTFDRAAALCDQGEIGQGLVWLAEALRLAEEAGPDARDDLQLDIRRSLAGWSRYTHRLDRAYQNAHPVAAVAFARENRILFAAVNADDECVYLCDRDNLAGQLARARHARSVQAMAFNSNLNLLLTGCKDGSVYLWSVSDHAFRGPVRLSVPSEQPVLAVALSRDGRSLLAGCADGNAYLWQLEGAEVPDVEKGNQQFVLSSRTLEHASGHLVYGVAFSPDGRYVLTGSGHPLRDGEARLWERDGAKLTQVVRLPHPHAVRAVAFATGKKMFATAGGSVFKGEAQLWVMTGDSVRPHGEPLPHQAEVYTAEFSPDGSLLVTGGQDRAARLWDVASGVPVGQPLRHAKDVLAATFSPDGRTVLTASEDRVLRFWEVASGLWPSQPFDDRPKRPILSACLSGDGRWLLVGGLSLTGGGQAEVLDLTTRQTICNVSQPGPIRTVAFNADATLLLTGGGDEKTKQGLVRLSDRQGNERGDFPHPDVVRCVAFHPDGKTFATGCDDGTIRVWEVGQLGKVPQREMALPRDAGKIYSIAYHPKDGRTLLAGSRDGRAFLLDVRTGRRLHEWTHPDSVLAVAFSQDGRRILTGYAGGARLWDWDPAREQDPVRPLGAPFEHQAGIFGVAFSDDARLALTGGTDGLVRLWDAETKRPLAPPWRHEGVVFAVAFAYGNKQVLTAGMGASLSGAVRLWPVLPAVEGERTHIELWTHVVNGLRLDSGAMSQMDYKAWKESDARLRNLGGLASLDDALRQEPNRVQQPGATQARSRHQPVDLRKPSADVAVPPVPTLPMAPPTPFSLEEALKYVPRETTALVFVDLLQVRDSKLYKEHASLLQFLYDNEPTRRFRDAGVSPLDVQRLLVAWSEREDRPLLLIQSSLKTESLKTALASYAAKYPGELQLLKDDDWGKGAAWQFSRDGMTSYMVVLKEGLIGTSPSKALLRRALEDKAGAPSKLKDRLTKMDTAKPLWAIAVVTTKMQTSLGLPKLDFITLDAQTTDRLVVNLIITATDQAEAGKAKEMIDQVQPFIRADRSALAELLGRVKVSTRQTDVLLKLDVPGDVVGKALKEILPRQ
jgi:WD40 repeat protein/tRNA A-37 threonylcarbamoyl transferase component Bud32